MSDKVWRMILTLIKLLSFIAFSIEMLYVMTNKLPWYCGTLVCVAYLLAVIWGAMEAIDMEEEDEHHR